MKLLKWILAICFIVCSEACADDYDYSLLVKTPYMNLQLDIDEELLYPLFPQLSQYMFVGNMVDCGVDLIHSVLNPFIYHQNCHGEWVWNSLNPTKNNQFDKTEITPK